MTHFLIRLFMDSPAISAPPRSFKILRYEGRLVSISLYFRFGLSSPLQLSSLQDWPWALINVLGSGLI